MEGRASATTVESSISRNRPAQAPVSVHQGLVRSVSLSLAKASVH